MSAYRVPVDPVLLASAATMLGALLEEVHRHNEEYQHTTPDALIQDAQYVLELVEEAATAPH